jgi:hypothetical protein
MIYMIVIRICSCESDERQKTFLQQDVKDNTDDRHRRQHTGEKHHTAQDACSPYYRDDTRISHLAMDGIYPPSKVGGTPNENAQSFFTLDIFASDSG